MTGASPCAENSEVKLKELIAGLRSLVLSEEDAVSVATLLREKNPSALDAWHRVSHPKAWGATGWGNDAVKQSGLTHVRVLPFGTGRFVNGHVFYWLGRNI